MHMPCTYTCICTGHVLSECKCVYQTSFPPRPLHSSQRIFLCTANLDTFPLYTSSNETYTSIVYTLYHAVEKTEMSSFRYTNVSVTNVSVTNVSVTNVSVTNVSVTNVSFEADKMSCKMNTVLLI